MSFRSAAFVLRSAALVLMTTLPVMLGGCGKLGKAAGADAGVAVVTVAGGGATITETVICGGNQTFEYKNRTFDVASGPALLAGGHCKVTLTDCTVTAAAPGMGMGAISAGAHASVTMTNTKVTGSPALHAGAEASIALTGGSLEGTIALDAGGRSHITASGVTIKGEVKHGSEAVIDGIAGVKGASQADSDLKKMATGGCDGYSDCYVKGGFDGQVNSKMLVEIGPTGHATSASYQGGNAPKSVQDCMVALGKTKSVASGPGQLKCELSGTISGGNSEIDSLPTFVKK